MAWVSPSYSCVYTGGANCAGGCSSLNDFTISLNDSEVGPTGNVFVKLDYNASRTPYTTQATVGSTVIGYSNSTSYIPLIRISTGETVGHINWSVGHIIAQCIFLVTLTYDPESTSSSSSTSQSSTSSESVGGESTSSSSSTSSFSTDSESFESSSTSSGSLVPRGISYYSDFQEYTSVANPLLGKSAQMQYSGFLKKDWVRSDVDFDEFGYGLSKVKNNKGVIFCEDASKLFDLEEGYLEMVLSLPYRITNGVYNPLNGDALDISEYVLWGVNIAEREIGQPGLYAALTPRGIEFTIFTADSEFTIVDTVTNTEANSNVLFQFFWGDDLYNVGGTTAFMVNGENLQLGNAPVSNDDIEGLNFCVLDTPFCYSNLECVIKRLVTYLDIPDFIRGEWASSSSTVSSESEGNTTSSSDSSSSSSSQSSSGSSSSSSSSSMPFIADVWVTNSLGDDMNWWNVYESNHERTDFTTGLNPFGVAKDLSGNIWVANSGSTTVSRFDVLSDYIRTDYEANSSPYMVAVDLSDNIWVTNTDAATVTMLDATSGYSKTTYVVGGYPSGVAVDSSNNIWVVSAWGEIVSKLDASSGYTRTDYATGGRLSQFIAIDSMDNVWVTNPGLEAVSKFDALAGYARTDYPAGSNTYGVAVDLEDNIWVSSPPGGFISRYDVSKGYSRRDYGIPRQPRSIAVDSLNNIWVTTLEPGIDFVYMLEVDRGYEITKTLQTGFGSYNLAIDFLVKTDNPSSSSSSSSESN